MLVDSSEHDGSATLNEEGVTEMNELGQRPSFDKFLKVANSLFPRPARRTSRRLGESTKMRPEDALSFNPSGGNVSKFGRISMVPSIDDIILAKNHAQKKDTELEQAKDTVGELEDSLQKLKWRINADQQRQGAGDGNATSDQELLDASEEALTQAEAAVVNATAVLVDAKAISEATAVGAAREVYYTTDGSEPNIEDSEEYSHFRGIRVEGMHNSVLTVTAIAVTVGDQDKRTITGRATQNFTIKATLPQRAEDQFDLVGKSIVAGLHTADQTEQWVPVAWSKVGHAEALKYQAKILTRRNAPMESEGGKQLRMGAKMAQRRFDTSLKANTQKLKDLDEMKDIKRVAVRKHVQSVLDKKGAQESFDASAIFLRSAKWTAHVEKSGARHRYRMVSDELAMAKMAKEVRKMQLERETTELKYAHKVAKEAIAIADDALRKEESADDDRRFEAKIATQMQAEAKQKEEAQLKVAASKGEAAAAEAAKSAAAVAAAGDDPASAVNLAKEALAGGNLAAAKAGAEQAAMQEAARVKEETAAAMQRAMAEFRVKQNEAKQATRDEDKQQNVTFTATLKYLDARLHRESVELLGRQMIYQEKGASLIHLQAQQTMGFLNKWYHQCEVDKFQAHVEYLQTQNVSLVWGAELRQRRTIQKLAEAAEAQARRDMLSAEAAKMLARAAVISAESARLAAWKKTYHLESKVKDLKHSHAKLQDTVIIAKAAAHQEVLSSEAEVAVQLKAVENSQQAVSDAAQKLHDAQAQKQEEQQLEQESNQNKADGVLKADDQEKQENQHQATSVVDEADAEATLASANSTLIAKGDQEAAAEAHLDDTKKEEEITIDKAKMVQRFLDRVTPMLGFAINATERSKSAALACTTMMTNASKHAEKAAAIFELSVAAHKLKYDDMLAKQADSRNLTQMLSISVEFSKMKSRYLAKAEATRIEWEERVKVFRPYADKQQKTFKKTVRTRISSGKQLPDLETAEEDALVAMEAQVEQLEFAQARTLRIVTTGCKTPPSEFNKKPAPFLDLMTKLRVLQKTWALTTVEEHEARHKVCARNDYRATPPVRTYTIAQKMEKKAESFMLGEHDSIVGSNEHRTEEAFKWRKKCAEAVLDRRREEEGAVASLKHTEAELNVTEIELKSTEGSYRNASLDSLFFRVIEGWGWHELAALTPGATAQVNRSRLERVTAAWHRDGSPVGPGSIAEWDMVPEGAVRRQDDQVEGWDTGYLHPNITSSCSTACELFAETECHTGRIGLECTRGQVFRARFALEERDTLADWFVCRCNQGSMQFAGREPIVVEHRKDKFVSGRILSAQAGAVEFSDRLRDLEAIPDVEANCWKDFGDWIATNTTITQTRAALERAALAPTEAAEKLYQEIRRLWYRDCLHKKDDIAPELLRGHFWGSTDGSFNVLNLDSAIKPFEGLTAEEKTAKLAKMDEQEAKAVAAEKLETEKELAKGIFPGDAASSAAADESKADDAAVDPVEPPSPVEAAAEEAAKQEKEKEEKLKIPDEAAQVLASVEEDHISQSARLEAADAELKEAQIALERAQRASDAEGAKHAENQVENLQTKVDGLKMELDGTNTLLDDIRSPIVLPEVPEVQNPETTEFNWYVGTKAYSADLPVQVPGVCVGKRQVGGIFDALERATDASMDRIKPHWSVVSIDIPQMCTGQFRPDVQPV